MEIFRWGVSSVLRWTILCELFFSAPLILVIGSNVYSEGALTVSSAIWMIAVGALLGILGAILSWYCIVLPQKNMKR